MGHYDNNYDADEKLEEESRVNDATESILNRLEKMNVDQLEFVSEIAVNVDEYMSFFNVIKKLNNE